MKNTLQNVPFDLLYSEFKVTNDLTAFIGGCKEKTSWVSTNRITTKPWIFEQLLAFLADHKLPRNADGKILGSEYFSTNFDPNKPWDRGLFLFLKINPRGLLLNNQVSAEGRAYCSLVPLILAAHKKYNGVKYSEWDRETIIRVVDKPLADAMLFEYTDNYTDEELVEIRIQGLTPRTGKNAGVVANPATTYSIANIKEYEIHLYPELSKRMRLQTWCAHPSNRTEYMILDPKDWDSMPPSILGSAVFDDDKPTPKIGWDWDI